ncbi:MAG: SEC-C metal-binding domain-containing protein, partial [Clostridiales bacterium]|nr:SEC-C metal-binding domain-containing protein [Clostridiales bacterium]
RISDVSEILTIIVRLYPQLQNIWIELAQSYEQEDKIGKAIKVWEELGELYPTSGAYAYELALAYGKRGWHKKALAYFERTVELDPHHAQAWMELIEFYDEAEDYAKIKQLRYRAAEAVKENRAGSLMLYAQVFVQYLEDKDEAAAESCLKAITGMLESDMQYTHEEREHAILDIIASIEAFESTEMFPYLRRIADLISDINADLRAYLDNLQRKMEIAALEEEGYADVLQNLLETIAKDCDCEKCLNNIVAMEASILYDLPGYIPQIMRLKEEQPNLYASHAAFFNEALITSDAKRLLYHRIKQLSKHGLQPLLMKASDRYADNSGQDPESEYNEELAAPEGPYRREEPKVGRNDPCPCGSGKKYKKCCGA